MTIDRPDFSDIPALKALWKEAFGDPDDFLDAFFANGFLPACSRCCRMENTPVAVLYWFDCECRGEKLAYLYAIATAKNHQGKGLCRTLMDDTHKLLKQLGYAGCVLVPGSESLFRFYEKAGYRTFGTIREFSCAASSTPAPMHQIDSDEYARLRRQYLPAGSVLQEGAVLSFLQTQAKFYAGNDFVFVVTGDRIAELLGSTAAAGDILSALQLPSATIRTVGSDKPFAMYYPLTQKTPPEYFGLALD